MLYMKKVLVLSLKSIFEVNRPDPVRPNPARPDLTIMLFDALYLKAYCRYGFKIPTHCLHTV